MPHAWIEYSVNIEDTPELQDLGKCLYDAMLQTGIFPVAGVRIRIQPVVNCMIGDLTPANAFIHIALRIGEGRTNETIKAATDAIFERVSHHLKPLADRQPLAVAMELSEIDGRYSYKMNNLRDYMRAG